MANNFYGNRNYIKNTFFNVVLSGGSWDATQSLEKLKNADLNDVAVSADDANSSTIIDIDLGVPRDVRMFAIPDNISTFTPSLTARQRIQGSNTPMWAGLRVDGAHIVGASTLSVTNTTASEITVATGETFSVRTTLASGQQVWSTYTADASAVVAASGTANISLTESIMQNHVDNDVIECNVGDFTAPLKLFDWEDVYESLYAYGALPWWNSAALTGKITEEQRRMLPYPVVKVFDVVIARYWRYELDDDGNRAWDQQKIHIPYLFVGNGYQPSLNPTYNGTSIDFLTETTVDVTLGGRRIYGDEPIARRFIASIPDLKETEAFGSPFDMQWQDGLAEEIMFVFDPDDKQLMHRRAFLATQEQLNPIAFPYYNHNNINFELLEVL